MGSFPDLDPDFQAQVARRTPEAGQWIESLPQTWERLSRLWDMTAAGQSRTGMTSLVLPVVVGTSRTPAVVKLVSPAASATNELTALKAFDGHGAVRLLDADINAQALLLEELHGPALSDLPDEDSAIQLAGRIASELAQVTAPAGAPSLAAQAGAWLPELCRQHERALHASVALPESVYQLAIDVVRELAGDQTKTLTHGDLSLFNILYSARGWLAIDPLLVAGTVAWEAHTVIRSYLTEIAAGQQIEDEIERRTRLFADAANVNHTWAARLSLARFAASYYWESQNIGDTENVKALHKATLATAKSLTR